MLEIKRPRAYGERKKTVIAKQKLKSPAFVTLHQFLTSIKEGIDLHIIRASIDFSSAPVYPSIIKVTKPPPP